MLCDEKALQLEGSAGQQNITSTRESPSAATKTPHSHKQVHATDSKLNMLKYTKTGKAYLVSACPLSKYNDPKEEILKIQ